MPSIILGLGFCFLSQKDGASPNAAPHLKKPVIMETQRVLYPHGGFVPDPFVLDCESHFKVKDYNYVIKKYLEAKPGKIPVKDIDSLNTVARLLGPCYENTGHIREALPYLRLALGKDFRDLRKSQVCHYADLCLVTGDYQGAKTAYEAVIARGSQVDPPAWPFQEFYEMQDYPERWSSDKIRQAFDFHNTHPNPPTPLGTPKVSNPTFNQARAIAYYLVGQRAIYTEGYPTDTAHLKIAAQLYPTSPEILWQYAENLHAIHQDKSAFIEYDLAEKAATGDVKEAIHELRRQDDLEVRAAYFMGRGDSPAGRVWKDRIASDFKNIKLAPYDLNTALDLPKGANALKP